MCVCAGWIVFLGNFLKYYFGGKFELEKSLMVNAKCCALFRTSSASIAAKVYSRSVLLSFRIIISRIIIIIQPEQVMLFDTAPPPPSARVSSGNLTVCASCVFGVLYWTCHPRESGVVLLHVQHRCSRSLKKKDDGRMRFVGFFFSRLLHFTCGNKMKKKFAG